MKSTLLMPIFWVSVPLGAVHVKLPGTESMGVQTGCLIACLTFQKATFSTVKPRWSFYGSLEAGKLGSQACGLKTFYTEGIVSSISALRRCDTDTPKESTPTLES